MKSSGQTSGSQGLIPHHLPDPEHVRGRMPARFSWVDQLALERLQSVDNSHAYSLYLLLVMLGDRYGLSYYSDKRLAGRLRIDLMQLRHLRRQLVGAGLIAYRSPFYQVRDLRENTQGDNRTARPKPEKPRAEQRQEMTEEQTAEVCRQLRALRDSLR